MDKQTEQELLKIVRQNYQAIAESFDQTRQKKLWPELEKLANQVKDNDAVLDIGCGNGRLFKLWQDKPINYTGLDNCQPLLTLAQTNFANSNNQPKFLEADILDLSQLPQLNFDYIFCIALLHHLPGQRLRLQALRQLKNKVTNNGRIIITVWNFWSQQKYRRLIIKFWLLKWLKKNRLDFGDMLFDWQDPQVKTYNQRYYHAFNKRELQKLAQEAGLQIEQLYSDKYNYYLIVKR